MKAKLISEDIECERIFKITTIFVSSTRVHIMAHDSNDKSYLSLCYIELDKEGHIFITKPNNTANSSHCDAIKKGNDGRIMVRNIPHQEEDN